jgi:hypothetical protein
LTFLNKGTAEKEERVLEAGHLGFLRHLLFNSSASCQLTLVLHGLSTNIQVPVGGHFHKDFLFQLICSMSILDQNGKYISF